MDHYSSEDRTALVRAVWRLLGHCDCYSEADYRPPETPRRAGGCDPGPGTRRFCPNDGTTYCAFEEGSGTVVDSAGAVRCHRSFLARQPTLGAPLERLDLGGAVRVPGLAWQDPNHASASRVGDAPRAPLPAAFRVCRMVESRPPSVKFDVPVRGTDGIEVETEWQKAGQLYEKTIKFPRGAFENGTPPLSEDIARGLESAMEEYEDRMCLELLSRLGAAGETYTYRWNSTLDDLARFVNGLNAPRPGALRLDTVIVNFDMYMTLFGNDRRTPSWTVGYPFYDGELRYKNMSVLGGIAFLHHSGVPPGCAYALSSGQGPVFAHGPSTIDCKSDEIAVTRRCGIVEPSRGLPECPWGVRFGAEKKADTGGERPDGDG